MRILNSLAFASLLLLLGSVPMHAQKAPKQKIVTSRQVNGVWKTKNSIIMINALGNNELYVEFEGTYPHKTADGDDIANIGTYSGTARIEGTTAVITNANDDANCTITLRFEKGRLKVEQQGVCGFGNGVSADGVYRRTSRRIPERGC